MGLRSHCSHNDLPQVMEWMVQHGNDSQLPWLISKIALAALIYHVWGERNGRIFQAHGCDMQQLDVQVTTDMRACASSWRKVTNMAFCSSWNIPARVFDKV